ncbi:MAG: hypothetical protein MIO90_06095 [Methanomassiliicoccales archaeon]|nr:hypothetical protein [Methanomassiliicoccales archaeon]
MLLGWGIAFEGFFALSIADQTLVDGIGNILSSTVLMAALQLTALGVFISIVWALKAAAPSLDRPRIKKALSALTYLAMAMVALEGLMIVFMAGNVNIDGFGSVGKKYIVLTGAQLFVLGIMSLRQWRLRNTIPTNWVADSLGSIAAALLMMEGLTVMGVAGTASVKGVGTILESTIYDAGLQLFLLGAAIFIIWTMTQDPLVGPRVSKVFNERTSLIIMVILGGIVAAEGLVASTMAGRTAIEGSGSVIKVVVVAGCAQLFALGLISPLLWKMSRHQLDRSFIFEFLGPMAMAFLAFEGVFAMGLAANTYIEGIGTMMESTFRDAGLQLLVLSAIGLLAWQIKDSKLLGKRTARLVIFVPILVMGIVALEGLAATILAVYIRIDDFSSVRESYVLLGGAQMVILAAIALLCWARSQDTSVRFKITGTVAAAFVVLMLPIALLL